jgi:hypothetical protein
VSTFGLTEHELCGLRALLISAIEGRCIPEWEFEPLTGCSREEAREFVDTGLNEAFLDERGLDQLVVLLSALLGSVQTSSRRRAHGHASAPDFDLTVLYALLARLVHGTDERPERESSVTLRVPHQVDEPQKRGA